MRLISKLPDVPNLSEKSIRMISDLLFIDDKPFYYNKSYDFCYLGPDVWGKYDPKFALQIMGNIAFLKDMFSEEVITKIKNMRFTSKIIFTGGINPEYRKDTEETRYVKKLYTENGKYDWNDVLTTPQSEIMYNRCPLCLGQKPRLEKESTNTKENFTKVKEAGWYEIVEHLRLLTTAESTLRVLATARKHLPDLQDIATISYTPTFPEKGLRCDKENWAASPLSQQYVYGELLRVIKYDEMGEIKLKYNKKRALYNIIRELNIPQY